MTGNWARGGGNHIRGTARAPPLPRQDSRGRLGSSGPVAAGLRPIVKWRERERERRELATMASRDFGDLAVPPGLIREELRRWPWQARSQVWNALAAAARRPRPSKATNAGALRSIGQTDDFAIVVLFSRAVPVPDFVAVVSRRRCRDSLSATTN